MPRRLPLFRQSLLALQNYPKPIESQGPIWHAVPTLPDASLATFKSEAFEPARPFLLPEGTFSTVPAIGKWFQRDVNTGYSTLNLSHLKQYGDTMLPVEYSNPVKGRDMAFQRGSAPLALFLSWMQHATSSFKAGTMITQKLYIAQAPLSLLPASLHNDLPVPEYVQEAGKGDIYDSSLWMGLSPTYTPLHRDPNPNLFVQLGGEKQIRILSPETGDRLFGCMREEIGDASDIANGQQSVAYRGEEMMMGEEYRALEDKIWHESTIEDFEDGWEAYVKSGDGIFIPKGFWHSVKGIGEGLTASVNWWFR